MLENYPVSNSSAGPDIGCFATTLVAAAVCLAHCSGAPSLIKSRKISAGRSSFSHLGTSLAGYRAPNPLVAYPIRADEGIIS